MRFLNSTLSFLTLIVIWILFPHLSYQSVSFHWHFPWSIQNCSVHPDLKKSNIDLRRSPQLSSYISLLILVKTHWKSSWITSCWLFIYQQPPQFFPVCLFQSSFYWNYSYLRSKDSVGAIGCWGWRVVRAMWLGPPIGDGRRDCVMGDCTSQSGGGVFLVVR